MIISSVNKHKAYNLDQSVISKLLRDFDPSKNVRSQCGSIFTELRVNIKSGNFQNDTIYFESEINFC